MDKDKDICHKDASRSPLRDLGATDGRGSGGDAHDAVRASHVVLEISEGPTEPKRMQYACMCIRWIVTEIDVMDRWMHAYKTDIHACGQIQKNENYLDFLSMQVHLGQKSATRLPSSWKRTNMATQRCSDANRDSYLCVYACTMCVGQHFTAILVGARAHRARASARTPTYKRMASCCFSAISKSFSPLSLAAAADCSP